MPLHNKSGDESPQPKTRKSGNELPQFKGMRSAEPPVVLIKWYDWLKWLLERVDSFPKNQRFIFGQRMADYGIVVLELLVEAAYSPHKAELLARANRQIEVLRWLVRLAKDRDLLTVRQYGFACKGLTECGRMVGGWLKQSAAKIPISLKIYS